MRGTPYLKLRQAVAHALRRAIVGSLGLACFAIALAAWGSVALDRSTADAETAAVATSAAEPSALISARQPETASLPSEQPALVVVRPPAVQLVEPRPVEDVEPEPARRVRVEAAQQLAGPPPPTLDLFDTLADQVPSIEERHAALVARAAARVDQPAIVEPPFVVTQGQTGSPPLVPGDVIEATISFYYCEQGGSALGDGGGFCGAMRDGTAVYEGAAACALTYLGQRFQIVGDPSGRIYTCHDTGNAVAGVHRDIFFYSAADGWSWLFSVGTSPMLEIVD